MPKITSVEPQKKSASRQTKRFNIFLDGKFGFGADEDLVVSRRLVVGKELSLADLEKTLFEAEVGKLMERMYALFNIRQRSEKEIRDYLKKLSFKRKVKGQEEISEVATELLLSQLKRKGLLNDDLFAKNWLEARLKKYGINRVKLELFKKGIARETIDEVINSQSSVFQQAQTAQIMLEKKIKNWKSLSILEFRKKAFAFLIRKGFEYSQAKDVVEKVLKKTYNNSREFSEESEDDYDF